MKKNNKKGFTLAELLIVVAIIAVLVLIAIPVFTASLNKSKGATDEANARSLYAALTAEYLADGTYTAPTGAVTVGTAFTLKDKDGNEYAFSDQVTELKISAATDKKAPTVTIKSSGVDKTFGTTN